MSSLVVELQREAMDESVPIGALLRKALVVSRKLGASEIEKWLRLELEGYSDSKEEIPTYREVSAQLKVRNPYHGLQPLLIGDPEFARRLSANRIAQAAGELCELVRGRSSTGSLHLNISPAQKATLMKSMDVPMEPVFTVSHTAISHILEVVRTRVLDWALALESEGVLGEGMSFSAQEKAAAPSVSYVITNNIGSMQNSQIQQHSSGTQTMMPGPELVDVANFVVELRRSASSLGLDAEKRNELLADCAALESQTASPKPKKGIITESLRSIKRILENAAGSAAGELLIKLTPIAAAAGLALIG